MNVRTRVILFLGILSVFALLAAFVYLEYFIKASFTDSVHKNVRQITELSKSVYVAHVEGLKVRVLNWSSDRYVKALSEEILSESTTPAKKAEAIEEFTRYFQKEKMRHDPLVIIVDLLDKDGIIVASSRATRIGGDEAKDEQERQAHYFSKTITARFGEVYLRSMVFEEDEDPRPMFHITTRMFSSQLDLQGEPKPLDGVLLIHFVTIQELASLLSQSAQHEEIVGLSEGVVDPIETFLVNRDNRIVVSSTIHGDDFEVGRIDNPPLIYECLDLGNEGTREYVNHHGVDVLGASACLKDEGIVVVTEIPATQAYFILNKLTRETFIFGIGVFTVILSVLFWGGRRILKKIEKILILAKKVTRGDFEARASVSENDEIGLVARAFNSVLDTTAFFQKNLNESNQKLVQESEKLSKDLLEHKKQEQFLEQSKRATLNLLEDTWKTKEALEVRERRLQTLLASIPNAIFLIDRDYKIEMVNPRAEKYTGFSLKDLVGRDFRTLVTLWKKQKEKVRPEEDPIEKTFLTGMMQTTGLEDKLSLTTEKHPLHLPVTVSVTPLREDVHDEYVKAVVVIHDITHDRELDEARSGFISIASHQLRTPLTTIRWYSEMLLDEDVGSLSPSQRDFLNEIHEGSQRLYKTIDLLLGISRIESGKQKAEPQNIDLTMFTQEILKELSPQSNEKNLVVSMVPPEGEHLLVWLDPLRLRQVITNLLTNAIRYNNIGGIIEVSWRIVEDGREVSYSVRDTGIGIPIDDQDKLFTKFFRAENALVQAPDGSGLGLPLVRDIVETWGGQIRFSTTENKGSIFTFTIPLVSAVPYLPNTEAVA